MELFTSKGIIKDYIITNLLINIFILHNDMNPLTSTRICIYYEVEYSDRIQNRYTAYHYERRLIYPFIK